MTAKRRRPTGCACWRRRQNALRIPFLREVFPEARFIYLHRDPRQVLGSMIDGWQSGEFVMYPNLPGWNGPPWSFLLTPDWRALSGQPLGRIVAAQWETTTRLLLDDLAALPADAWTTVDHGRFLASPRPKWSASAPGPAGPGTAPWAPPCPCRATP
ncbi:sulfotransferase [Arenimonas daejeonensis]|uniref:sulfotransferase n=1 Tax=Arenimonas daejeonensis TaxID=370777 RepID=UPI0013151967